MGHPVATVNTSEAINIDHKPQGVMQSILSLKTVTNKAKLIGTNNICDHK